LPSINTQSAFVLSPFDAPRHGFHGRLEDVDLVYALVVDHAHRLEHSVVRHELLEHRLAVLLRHLLAVVDGVDDQVLGEHARRGHHGARQRAASGFIHAADDRLAGIPTPALVLARWPSLLGLLRLLLRPLGVRLRLGRALATGRARRALALGVLRRDRHVHLDVVHHLDALLQKRAQALLRGGLGFGRHRGAAGGASERARGGAGAEEGEAGGEDGDSRADTRHARARREVDAPYDRHRLASFFAKRRERDVLSWPRDVLNARPQC
jgi:hypothetical protein